MAMQWNDRLPQRPDRYLDWELANWTGTKERWCSVLIQVLPGLPGSPAMHLATLKSEVDAQPVQGVYTIKMNADELELLATRKIEVENGAIVPDGNDDVRLEFFVYLPESRTYANGAYAIHPHYRIRFAGPPIDGFDPNRISARNANQHFLIAGAMKQTNVAIGIIDDGIAFANQRFRTRYGLPATEADKTRIRHIWLQDQERITPDDRVAFGTRLDASEIDGFFHASKLAIGSVDDRFVYRRAKAIDFSKEGAKSIAHRRAHGTHVMDLACGFEPDDAAGKDRPILAVQLPDAATADTSGVTMGSYVLQGLRQIMLWADKLDPGQPAAPLVVNFSYGISAGSKDGRHVLEHEIDRLVEYRKRTTPTAIVLPSGNFHLNRMTAAMTLTGQNTANATQNIDWMILPDDQTPSFLEIWFDAGNAAGTSAPFEISIVPPIGPAGPGAMPVSGKSRVMDDAAGPICAVYYDTPDANLGRYRSRVVVAINPTRSFERKVALAPSGCWKLQFTNKTAANLKLELGIQRDDSPTGYRRKGRQSYFDHKNAYEKNPETGSYDKIDCVDPGRECPITHHGTLSAIGTGQQTVVVGAAEDDFRIGSTVASAPFKPNPSEYASSGPTPARAGPDLSAVADQGPAYHGVLAAGALTGAVVAMRGTSVAAPQITRRLADAAASIATLKQQLGASPTPDPRLGCVTIPLRSTPEIPRRKWPS